MVDDEWDLMHEMVMMYVMDHFGPLQVSNPITAHYSVGGAV